MAYIVAFNNNDTYASAKDDDDEDEAEGPVVERRCPQCNNDKMSYATLQLRSADEGQTVFYTCTKCKYVKSLILIRKRFGNIGRIKFNVIILFCFRFKETENS